METQESVETKKEKAVSRISKLLGILILLFTCLSMVGSVALDLTGEKAIGKVSNAAKDCSSNGTCWTGQVDFTTQQGENITFNPWTNPYLFDLDPVLSGRSYEDYGKYQVRYFKDFPKLAKVKLAYALEYTVYLGWFCGGSFLLVLGAAFSSRKKANKPMVIDLSGFRKK